MADTTVAPKAPDFYVYILFNPLTCEPFYVGKGRRNRCFHHLRDAFRCRTRKDRLIHMLQSSNIEVPIVKIAEGLQAQPAYDLERALIAALGRSPSGPLLNRTSGGEGVIDPDDEWLRQVSERSKARIGWRHSSATIEKMRVSAKLRGFTSEHRANITKALIGRKLSEEHKKKVGAAGVGRKRDKPMSAEARRKIGDSRLGKPWLLTGIYKHSDEVRERLKNSWSDRPDAEQVRRRLGERSRGKHWYNNGIKHDVYSEGAQPDGWTKGRLPQPVTARQLEVLRTAVKGKIRITDGLQERLWPTDTPIPDGWQRGRSGVMVAALKRSRKR